MKTLGFVSLHLVCPWGCAQDPTGVLEGQASDPANAAAPHTVGTAQNAPKGTAGNHDSKAGVELSRTAMNLVY